MAAAATSPIVAVTALGSSAASSAQSAAGTVAGATSRTTVRVTVRGTSVATSTTAHTTQQRHGDRRAEAIGPGVEAVGEQRAERERQRHPEQPQRRETPILHEMTGSNMATEG